MITPPLPENESARLNTLYKLKILDTFPEERFDQITRLAQTLFKVPMVLISFVDKDRQWFKSKQGLDVNETPRDISFCGHTILENDILVVENSTQDPRFYDNPLVVNEPKIRFYAGAPLSTYNMRVGTLCLVDTQAREFNAKDQKMLRKLADMVERELET